LFQGKTSDGKYYQIPNTFGGGYTPFPLSGNPRTQEGWIDGKEFPPGNRNFGLSTGPINLKVGESVIIIFAQVAAGGFVGNNRNESIDSIKAYAKSIKNFYKSNLDSVTSVEYETNYLSSRFAIFQNYPNPFNSTTQIKFSIPEEGLVTLKVYNTIGQEVATLVNEFKARGTYEVDFNASNLASGVYMYTLYTSKTTLSKKMLLIK
jgi:hypothetical protein